jgi:hypothetical protein
MPTHFEPNQFQMHSLRAFFELLGLPSPLGMAAYLVAAVAVLAIA